MSEAKENAIEEKVVREISASKGEPLWLLEMRSKSFASFLKLPVEISPLYAKYADLKGTNLVSIDPLAYSLVTESEFQSLENNLRAEGKPFVLHNGPSFTRVEIPQQLRDEGVVVSDLFSVVKDKPQLVEGYLANPAIKSEEDKIAALNNALFNTGHFVYIPKDLEIKVPMRISSYVPSASNVIVQAIIILDEGSKATIIQDYYSSALNGSKISHYSENTNIFLGQESELNFVGIQALKNNAPFFANRRAFCQRDSIMKWTFGFFGGFLTRSRVDSSLDGAGSSAEDLEFVFGNESQRFDVVSDLTHRGPHTRGVNLARGVLKDKSRSIFKGMIRIHQGAKNAEAYLAEHVMLLNREARSNAIPGLEIQTNEVRATHSASVAQIDEEQVFYLMSRGLSEEEAKETIVQGFFQPVAERVALPEVRRTIRLLMEQKWRGLENLQTIEFEEEELVEPGRGVEDLFARHYKYRR